MSNLPDPPVPADLDLHDFPYMPLDVVRLRDSDLANTATDGAFRAAVLLWSVAWHQVPAASLPTDERQLARYVGVDLKKWRRLSSEALHGFIECSDGRLYHPVVAEKALQAKEKRKSNSDRTAKATAARLAKKAARSDDRNDDRYNARSDKRGDERDEKRHELANGQRHVHQGKGREGKGEESHTHSPLAARERESGPSDQKAEQPDPWVKLMTEVVAAYEAAGSPNPVNTSQIDVWRHQEFRVELVRAVLLAGIAGKPDKPLKYWQNSIIEAHKKPNQTTASFAEQHRINGPGAPSPRHETSDPIAGARQARIDDRAGWEKIDRMWLEKIQEAKSLGVYPISPKPNDTRCPMLAHLLVEYGWRTADGVPATPSWAVPPPSKPPPAPTPDQEWRRLHSALIRLCANRENPIPVPDDTEMVLADWREAGHEAVGCLKAIEETLAATDITSLAQVTPLVEAHHGASA